MFMDMTFNFLHDVHYQILIKNFKKKTHKYDCHRHLFLINKANNVQFTCVFPHFAA